MFTLSMISHQYGWIMWPKSIFLWPTSYLFHYSVCVFPRKINKINSFTQSRTYFDAQLNFSLECLMFFYLTFIIFSLNFQVLFSKIIVFINLLNKQLLTESHIFHISLKWSISIQLKLWQLLSLFYTLLPFWSQILLTPEILLMIFSFPTLQQKNKSLFSR